MHRSIVCLALVCALTGVADAVAEQRGRTTTRKPAPATPKKPVPKTEPADVSCPEQLGTGLKTKQLFCFVLAGRDPTEGVIVRIPPHSQATITFDLHNRHNEELWGETEAGVLQGLLGRHE